MYVARIRGKNVRAINRPRLYIRLVEVHAIPSGTPSAFASVERIQYVCAVQIQQTDCDSRAATATGLASKQCCTSKYNRRQLTDSEMCSTF